MTRITTDPNDPDLGHGADDGPVPQNKAYLVLPAEERAKGFVRPYRDAYRHVGLQPQFPLRDLTQEERERFNNSTPMQRPYVKFEPYPEGFKRSATGRFWTQERLDTRGCGTVTSMGRELSETYARKPTFYGSTYCVTCQMHKPVAEFVWLENDGREEHRVGS